MNYWLMKTEPSEFSFDDLVACTNSTDHWQGVRNYQARNLMRDEFRLGDLVFIYHSRTPDPAIVGIAEVVREAYPDPTALDKKSPYFDSKSHENGQSRWVMVDVAAKLRFKHAVTLSSMRGLCHNSSDNRQGSLSNMTLLRPGMRLSVQPVSTHEWQTITQLGCPYLI